MPNQVMGDGWHHARQAQGHAYVSTSSAIQNTNSEWILFLFIGECHHEKHKQICAKNDEFDDWILVSLRISTKKKKYFRKTHEIKFNK